MPPKKVNIPVLQYVGKTVGKIALNAFMKYCKEKCINVDLTLISLNERPKILFSMRCKYKNVNNRFSISLILVDDKIFIRFGDMGYGDLFSLAKIISNSPYGLVGYYMARLNKSTYPISPHRININYSVKPCNIRRGFSRVGYYLGETE